MQQRRKAWGQLLARRIDDSSQQSLRRCLGVFLVASFWVRSQSSPERPPKPRVESVPAFPSSSMDALDWIGHYEIDSPLCSDPETWGQCRGEFKDCISVESSAGGWNVELYSVQAMQNLCAFSLLMHQVGGKLVYDDGKGGEIILQEREGKLVLSSLGLDPGKAGFCGAHGIDGVSFPISSRKPVHKRCFDENRSRVEPNQ